MTDIPRDVLLAAAQTVIMFPAFKTVEETSRVIDLVARAILAERERCAAIADTYAIEPDPDEMDPYDDYDMGTRSSARRIAAAIRDPQV